MSVDRTLVGSLVVLGALVAAGCGGPTGPGLAPDGEAGPTAKFADRGRGLDGKADDAAQPVTLAILEPTEDQVVQGNRVTVRFTLGNYTLGKGADGTGNHIHFILDNEPYVPWYDGGQPYVCEDVSEGTHVLRAFASRPWHESWKNPEAFASVQFHVGSRGSPPTYDAKAPLLTYSRPKGTYKGADGEKLLLDFWVGNCTLSAGDHAVRLTLDGVTQPLLHEWAPRWLTALAKGKHTLRLELVDGDGRLVAANAWNRTEREITIE